MNISSRTPEGSPNQCRLCGATVRLEPSQPPGDAPCPNCGALLWFNNAPQLSPKEIALRVVSRLLISGAVVTAAILTLMLLGVLFGLQLSATEYAIVVILAVLLFGRPLPDVGRRFGKFAAHRFSRHWMVVLASATFVAALALAILAVGLLGLRIGGAEGAIAAVLALLLFGRPLPELGRYLGRLAVRQWPPSADS